MSAIEAAVQHYVTAWNARDERARMEALSACWAEGGTFTTPGGHYVGREQLLEAIHAFRSAHPEDEAVLTSVLEQHRSTFRFVAHLVRPDGTTWGETMDAGEIDADGRIIRILSFPGATPAPQ